MRCETCRKVLGKGTQIQLGVDNVVVYICEECKEKK
jgi:hypothetical protein